MMFTPSDNQTFLLASHLPQGKVWEQARNPDSNLGKLVRALGVEYYRCQVLFENLYNEMDINQANEILAEWEKSVGIPCLCFADTVTLADRREQVLQKFSNFGGVQTAADFVRVAAVFGHDITVLSGRDVGTFPLGFPLVFFATDKEMAHTVFIIINGDLSGGDTFPLPFPLPFSSGVKDFLQCIFDMLAPANVKVLIKSEGEL